MLFFILFFEVLETNSVHDLKVHLKSNYDNFVIVSLSVTLDMKKCTLPR